MKAIVHGAPWDNLKNKKSILVRAAADVDIDLYWRQLHVIIFALLLALFALQISDSNKSNMEQIY